MALVVVLTLSVVIATFLLVPSRRSKLAPPTNLESQPRLPPYFRVAIGICANREEPISFSQFKQLNNLIIYPWRHGIYLRDVPERYWAAWEGYLMDDVVIDMRYAWLNLRWHFQCHQGQGYSTGIAPAASSISRLDADYQEYEVASASYMHMKQYIYAIKQRRVQIGSGTEWLGSPYFIDKVRV